MFDMFELKVESQRLFIEFKKGIQNAVSAKEATAIFLSCEKKLAYLAEELKSSMPAYFLKTAFLHFTLNPQKKFLEEPIKDYLKRSCSTFEKQTLLFIQLGQLLSLAEQSIDCIKTALSLVKNTFDNDIFVAFAVLLIYEVIERGSVEKLNTMLSPETYVEFNPDIQKQIVTKLISHINTSDTALEHLMSEKSNEKLKICLEKGLDPNQKTKRNSTPLEIAIRLENKEAENLLKSRSNVECKNLPATETEKIKALLSKQDYQAIKYLKLFQKEDFNAKDIINNNNLFEPVLHVAMKYVMENPQKIKHFRIIFDFLINSGYPIDAQDKEGDTLFMYFIKHMPDGDSALSEEEKSSISIIRTFFLVRPKKMEDKENKLTSVTIKNKQGVTALEMAIQKNQADIATQIIDYGKADTKFLELLHNKCEEFLEYFATINNLTCFEFLFDIFQKKNSEGDYSNKHFNILLKKALVHKANLVFNFLVNDSEMGKKCVIEDDLLHLALHYEVYAIAEILIKKGVSVSYQKENMTALSSLIKLNKRSAESEKIFRLILNKANNFADVKNLADLEILKKQKPDFIVYLLENKRFDFNSREILSAAIELGYHINYIKKIIERGAPLDSETLKTAIHNSQMATVQLLIQKGIKFSEEDDIEKTIEKACQEAKNCKNPPYQYAEQLKEKLVRLIKYPQEKSNTCEKITDFMPDAEKNSYNLKKDFRNNSPAEKIKKKKALKYMGFWDNKNSKSAAEKIPTPILQGLFSSQDSNVYLIEKNIRGNATYIVLLQDMLLNNHPENSELIKDALTHSRFVISDTCVKSINLQRPMSIELSINNINIGKFPVKFELKKIGAGRDARVACIKIDNVILPVYFLRHGFHNAAYPDNAKVNLRAEDLPENARKRLEQNSVFNPAIKK